LTGWGDNDDVQKGVHQKLGNYKIDPSSNGPVYMEEHILSDLLRNVTNQIAVPFGVAVLATEETTIAVDMLGDLQGSVITRNHYLSVNQYFNALRSISIKG